MSEQTTITCDNPTCHRIKQQANRWWTVRVPKPGDLRVRPFSSRRPLDGDKHYCSEACLQWCIGEWIKDVYASSAVAAMRFAQSRVKAVTPPAPAP